MAQTLTRRTLLHLLFVSSSATLLNACAPAAPPSPTAALKAPAPTPAAPKTAQPTTLPAKDAQAELLEKAKQEGTLTLYTGLAQTASTSLTEAFTKQTGIKVESLLLGGEESIARVLKEAEANIHMADVVIATSTADLLVYKERKLLAPYKSVHHEKLIPGLGDSEGYFEPLYTSRYIMAYNSKLVPPAEAPKSYTDLADPKWKGKLVLPNPANAIGAAIVVDQIVQLHGWELLEKVAKNNVAVGGNVAETLNMLIAGERQVSIFAVVDQVITHKKSGNPLELIFPSEGIVTAVAAVGVMAKAPHPNAARLMVDHLLSEQGQQILADTRRDAARPGVKYDPDIIPPATQKILPVDYVGYATRRPKVLENFRRLFQGG